VRLFVVDIITESLSRLRARLPAAVFIFLDSTAAASRAAVFYFIFLTWSGTMSILTFHTLTQAFGAVDIFSGLTATIAHQAKIGLVGPNGIGKTTLLRVLAGLDEPSSGQVYVAKGIRIGYLQQEAAHAFTHPDNSLYGEMLTVFAGLQAQEAELRQLETTMSSGDFSQALLDQYGGLQAAFEEAGGYEYELKIAQTLQGLGFTEAQWGMPLRHCSGGQKTRALLARLLLEQPNLLIVDEPTNHLDVEAIEWLENNLRNWSGALLLVSHDRYFLDKVVNTIWEMSRHGLEVYRGNYSAYLRQRDERWQRREEEFNRAKEQFLKDLDFVKRNIARASTTDRAQGVLKQLTRAVKIVESAGTQALNESWARLKDEGLGGSSEAWTVGEVEQRIKALQNPNPRSAQPLVRLQTRQRSGQMVLRTKGVKVGYPGAPLFQTDKIELFRQECAALIGPNGTGKSTFLRTLLGELEPLAGEVQWGTNVKVAYFAQAHDGLKPERTVLEELLAQRNMPLGEARSYLARYLFRGEEVFKQVGDLSGGERGRLALALVALQGANLLLLDEPTNHLDLPTQEVLQAALQSFEGAILLVSHDRYLISQLATQIWDLREGRLWVHQGDFTSYQSSREQAQTKRSKEKVTTQSTFLEARV
jgi:ATP-binding cassette, subfamily F, member 3